MARRLLTLIVPIVLVATGAGLLASASPAGGRVTAATRPVPTAQSDLDAFMKRVLARRDENWKKLQEFILDEREAVEVRGPAGAPIWGQRREYSWYIQEGFFVRSPTTVDGVEIADDERRKYEADYLRRAQAREKREAEKAARDAGTEPGAAPPAGAAPPVQSGQALPPAQSGQAVQPGQAASRADAPGGLQDLLDQTRRPGFVDSAYFLKFKFEQGTYALVGRESFEGRDVLKIEYYPSQLFTHEQETERKRQEAGRRDRGEDFEAAIERMMNKVSLVTLWVEPDSHQIVKYTFDNVNMDFLPAAWLVRISDLQASMTMSQPFPDVWLPRDIGFHIGAMLAIGSFDIRYRIAYHDYREAKTSGRIRRIGGRP